MNHEECIDELEIRKNACMEDIREYRLEMMLRKVPEMWQKMEAFSNSKKRWVRTK